MKAKERDMYNDKVEISVEALTEIRRAFSALIADENSYVHRIFPDDRLHWVLKELKQTYADYFDEPVEKW